jgi:short-subunit dehydrogenase
MNKPSNAKVVIITGASSGIGAAVARRLACDGMRLTIAARRLEMLQMVAAEVESLGGEALAIQTDVCNHEDLERMVQMTLENWGHLDVLLNNAGVNKDRFLIRSKMKNIRDEVQINLTAVIECTQAVLPVMLRQKSGHIINVSSIAGLIALPGGSVYSATKFGVNGFSDALRRELHESGIKVSTFCPGFTPTELSPSLKAVAEGRSDARHYPGMMPTSYVADQVARLIRHPRRCIIIPTSWKLLVSIAFIFPGIIDILLPKLITRMNRETK